MPRTKADKRQGGGSSGAGAGAGGTTADRLPAGTVSQKELHEKLLSHVYNMYTNPSKVNPDWGSVGLEGITQPLGMQKRHPRRKIIVMIIGNHSAGKSSFVNWYVDDEVQNTGVAVETQGFTVVTSGNVSNNLKGEGALVMIPHIEDVVGRFEKNDAKAFVENLSVVVSKSRSKNFGSIDLIDTPGLVDGEVSYPFNVNSSIAEMAEIADLILVFLDPIGQALCTRTMDVVQDLNQKGYGDIMRYFLTKADTVARRSDLTKVIVQITQNLSNRVPSTHGFHLPTMWIPQLEGTRSETADTEVNELGKLCAEIVKTIDSKVQNNMATLRDHTTETMQRLDEVIAKEAVNRKIKSRWMLYRVLMWPLFPILVVLSFLDLIVSYEEMLPTKLVKTPIMQKILNSRQMLATVNYVPDLFGIDEPLERLGLWVSVFFIVMLFFSFFGCRSRSLKTRDSAGIKNLKFQRETVEAMQQHGKDLYREYVRSAQTPEYEE